MAIARPSVSLRMNVVKMASTHAMIFQGVIGTVTNSKVDQIGIRILQKIIKGICHMNNRHPSLLTICLSAAAFIVALACGCPSAGSASGFEPRDSDPKAPQAAGHISNPKDEQPNTATEHQHDVEVRIIWVDPYTKHRRLNENDVWTVHIGVMLIDRREHPEQADKNGLRFLSRAGSPDIEIAADWPDRWAPENPPSLTPPIFLSGPLYRTIYEIEENRFAVIGTAAFQIPEKPQAGVYEMRFKPGVWEGRFHYDATSSTTWFPFILHGDEPPPGGHLRDRLPWLKPNQNEK